MTVEGPSSARTSNVARLPNEQAVTDVANRAQPMNLFSADTMSGRRAVANTNGNTSGRTSGNTTGGRESMQDLLARMGATDNKKQAFDVASEAVSNVVKGGFKGAGEALGGISGIGDALGGIMKAAGALGGMIQSLMPIIGAVMSFF